MWLPDLWPAYYSRAKGCEVWDLDGNHYYDMSIMGVGANVLGYAYEEVDAAAAKAIKLSGMCTLNAPEEVYLAEKLIELHPWADMVRYTKTGGESMAMAVRIARAHTGKDLVLVCGYHGWHDWYLSANLVQGDPLADVHLKGLAPAGVPKGLAGTNLIFHYNHIEEFKQLVADNAQRIAAVVMEPIRNDYPEEHYLQEIRSITRKKNIVLIFDEITAGFRLCAGGSHLKLGVEPDIAVFAKAMTNGYPLSAVIGIKDIMKAAQDSFISSTFWTERIGLAAALKAIECYQKYNVEETLNDIGNKIRNGWKEISERLNVRIHISGIVPLSHFEFEYEHPLAYKTYFTQEMLKHGFLASTGIYASFSHSDNVAAKYLDACEKVFQQIACIHQQGKSIETQLDGAVCHSGFERLN